MPALTTIPMDVAHVEAAPLNAKKRYLFVRQLQRHHPTRFQLINNAPMGGECAVPTNVRIVEKHKAQSPLSSACPRSGAVLAMLTLLKTSHLLRTSPFQGHCTNPPFALNVRPMREIERYRQRFEYYVTLNGVLPSALHDHYI